MAVDRLTNPLDRDGTAPDELSPVSPLGDGRVREAVRGRRGEIQRYCPSSATAVSNLLPSRRPATVSCGTWRRVRTGRRPGRGSAEVGTRGRGSRRRRHHGCSGDRARRQTAITTTCQRRCSSAFEDSRVSGCPCGDRRGPRTADRVRHRHIVATRTGRGDPATDSTDRGATPTVSTTTGPATGDAGYVSVLQKFCRGFPLGWNYRRPLFGLAPSPTYNAVGFRDAAPALVRN
jgi:hypothetical protein